MQLIRAITSTWKSIIKQNNDVKMFAAAEYDFIGNSRALTIQKATSGELYWILTTTTEQKATSQKYLKELTDLSLDWKEIRNIAFRNTYIRCFQYKVLNNVIFLKKAFCL